MSGMPLALIVILSLQNPEDARTMCGTVQAYVVSRACETVLIGGSSGSPTFTILIPPEARRKFDRPPQTTYLFQSVCATGVEGPKREGLYSIVIKDPSQLRVGQQKDTPAFGEGAARACEAGVQPALPPARAVSKRAPGSKTVSNAVIVEVLVDEKGAVADARVLSSRDPARDAAALESVRQWKFTPASRRGRPVRFVTSVSVDR
jgi:TonB family protein